eukprot:Skav219132  [mRNA]  locus=scaffold1574:579434:586249:+ [translate_table: standard]
MQKRAPGALLADSMGLGKTRQAIAYILGVRAGLLVTPENTEIANEETPLGSRISEALTSVTAMVGEGKEITDWCRDEMVHYSFQEVEDGLNLPADAVEVSPKVIGKVMMLGIAKVNVQEYKGTLKQMNWWDWDLDQDKLDDDEYGDEYVDASIALALENGAGIRARRGAYAFAYLDDRLKKCKNNYFYNSQAERSQSTQLDLDLLDPVDPDDKVYGIRQEYAAVEFEKVLGGWLEVEGRFDKAPPGVLQRKIVLVLSC